MSGDDQHGKLTAATFAGLYRTYARDVYRFALYLTGDFALADDIVFETILRIWCEPSRFL